MTRLSDGRAVGGIGFKGQPDGGCVEIGYGLAPSARGHGCAAEAVIALVTVAADHGLVRVIADTTLDNIASQRTLIRAGFRLVSTGAEFQHYECFSNRALLHSRRTASVSRIRPGVSVERLKSWVESSHIGVQAVPPAPGLNRPGFGGDSRDWFHAAGTTVLVAS
jgi:hypothetical protein